MNRQLIESEAVRKAVNDAEQQWSRANDAWETVTWVVAHDPDVGVSLTESGKTRSFALHGAQSVGLPDLTIVYEDRDPFILIHAALFSDSKSRYIPQAH
jgi:hypothetical protein